MGQGCQIGSFGVKKQKFGSFEKQLAPKFLFGYLATFLLFCDISFRKFSWRRVASGACSLSPPPKKREMGHPTVV